MGNFLKLYHVVQWNDRYSIVAGSECSYYVMDMNIFKVISRVIDEDVPYIVCVKKIRHPNYGESLVTYSVGNNIKLWV